MRGLEGLQAIGGSLIVSRTGLVDLGGLENVRAVGYELELSSNEDLTDVTALHGVESVGGDLQIYMNTALPTASAEALRDAIGVENIAGEIQIEGNAE